MIMSLPPIDTHEFCRRADDAHGRVPLASLQRLASLLAAPEGELEWGLTGRSALSADGSRQAFLELRLDAHPIMRCARCLEPVAVTLSEQRAYRLVGDEAQAAQEDADDDEYDVLVASRRFNLDELIQDEAIMALPAVPRHERCESPAVSVTPDDQAPPDSPSEPGAERSNPFAVLAGMKRPRP